jgi:hypothetical protein
MKIIKIEFETKLGGKGNRVVWHGMFAKLGVLKENFYLLMCFLGCYLVKLM